MHVTPYLNFKGNCREAFEHYAKALGGTIEMMLTHADTPAAEHVGPEMQQQIMHARLRAGDVVLMGSDAPLNQFQPAGGLFVSLHVETPEEADRIFAQLAEGGNVLMAPEKTFWAERFGMAIDRFGTPWMINCEVPVASEA